MRRLLLVLSSRGGEFLVRSRKLARGLQLVITGPGERMVEHLLSNTLLYGRLPKGCFSVDQSIPSRIPFLIISFITFARRLVYSTNNFSSIVFAISIIPFMSIKIFKGEP
jgi:hypothetical protein